MYAFRNILENRKADIFTLVFYSVQGMILIYIILAGHNAKAWIQVIQLLASLISIAFIYFLRLYLSRTSMFLFQSFDVILQLSTVVVIISAGPLQHKVISVDMQNILFHLNLLLAYYTRAIEFRPYCFKISVVSLGRLLSRVLTFKHEQPTIVMVIN